MHPTIDILTFADLNVDHLQVWRELQRRNPQLASPLFSPQLHAECNAVRDGLEVAILKEAGEIVGFFPYHRDAKNRATPAMGHLADFQGAITKAGLVWDPQQVVRRAGLGSWRFDHLLAEQQAFHRFHVVSDSSPFIDLAQGVEAYLASRRKRGARELREAQRKERKIQRDVAPLRWEPNSRDPQIFDSLVAWKRAQIEQMRVWNCFDLPWTVPLLRRVHQMRTESVSGELGALYVGNQLLAASLGVRSEAVYHGWITTFNRRFARYSPGNLLILQLLRWAESNGITRIDMGKGDGDYKHRLANGSTPLAEGSVSASSLHDWGHAAWLRLREFIRASPLGNPAQQWTRRVRVALRPPH